MKITDEAVEAAAKALNPELWAEESLVPEVLRHSARWQKRHDVRAALLAALPHLTDDGAAATPPADKGVRSAQAAESATPVPAGAAAPSSPHLADWTEEDRGFVEIALSAADSGDAGHWPTVAAYLAAEVRHLRASEGATPAINRDQIAAVLRDHLWLPSESRCSCDDEHIEWVSHHQADAILALIEGAS